jgi:hypothetical protein
MHAARSRPSDRVKFLDNLGAHRADTFAFPKEMTRRRMASASASTAPISVRERPMIFG